MLSDGTVEQRVALATRLEEWAQWAEQGEEAGSPYLLLATRLRELVVRLQDEAGPPTE